MKKRVLTSLVLLLLLSSSLVFAETSFETGFLEEMQFQEASLEGLVWTKEGLVLEEGKREGSFTSKEIQVRPFEYCILSWNGFTARDSSIELQARFFHREENRWTEWMSWGIWEKSPKRHSFSSSSELSQISHDTAWVKGDNTRGTKVQIRGILRGEGSSLRRVSYSLYDSTKEERKVSEAHKGSKGLENIAHSQQMREPSIAPVMCSAVTLSTQLELLGEEYLPEEIALLSYDAFLNGFGNWSFTASTAGELGYKAYVSYGDEEELLRWLDQGKPVGISVQYSPVEGGSYPYVEGAPLSTPGHLITLRGYEGEGKERVYLVSDSAASSDENALLRYKASELMKAWTTRILYVVEEKEVSTSSLERKNLYLLPTDVEGEFLLEGKIDPIPTDFKRKAFKEKGGGLLAYTLKGDPRTYYGLQLRDENRVKIMGKVSLDQLTVYLMTNQGVTYVARAKEASSSPLMLMVVIGLGAALLFLGIVNYLRKKKVDP